MPRASQRIQGRVSMSKAQMNAQGKRFECSPALYVHETSPRCVLHESIRVCRSHAVPARLLCNSAVRVCRPCAVPARLLCNFGVPKCIRPPVCPQNPISHARVLICHIFICSVPLQELLEVTLVRMVRGYWKVSFLEYFSNADTTYEWDEVTQF